MSAPWIVGLVIAFNVALFGGGLIWMKRQVRRVAAERAKGYRGLFKRDPLPPSGEAVQVLVEDDKGTLDELEAVHWPYLGWVDAISLLPVEDDVLGWRHHLFRARQANMSDWSTEKLDAELAKLDPDDEGAAPKE